MTNRCNNKRKTDALLCFDSPAPPRRDDAATRSLGCSYATNDSCSLQFNSCSASRGFSLVLRCRRARRRATRRPRRDSIETSSPRVNSPATWRRRDESGRRRADRARSTRARSAECTSHARQAIEALSVIQHFSDDSIITARRRVSRHLSRRCRIIPEAAKDCGKDAVQNKGTL